MRTEPRFGKKDSLESQTKNADVTGLGCVWVLLFLVVGYFGSSAANRVTSGRGSTLDQIICYGILSFFVIAFLLDARSKSRDRKAVEAERQQWKNTCVSADVAIVSRQHNPGGASDDGYDIRFFSASWNLDLELNLAQRAVVPNQTAVRVEVGEYLYKKLEKRDTVRIYYKPESPMTFLLEEEF